MKRLGACELGNRSTDRITMGLSGLGLTCNRDFMQLQSKIDKLKQFSMRYKEFRELIQPFKDSKQVSQLDRKLLKTTGLDCSTDKPSICRIDASQYAILNLQNRNLFSESKKMTRPSPSHLNDDYLDELKGTDGEKYLDAHYANAKPIGKALPRKEKDPGSFILPCFIKNMYYKALADLGESVSVMPYSTYTILGLGDLIPTKLIVELADRIVKQPKGIVDNVLVGIDKFTFPVDFIILDILEDFMTPLILVRPFLSTAHAIINVFKAKITLSVRNDKILFKSNKPASNIIKRVYALSVIKNTELGLETRLMGDELGKNKLQDLNFEDFIELNDPNEPIEHRRNQVKVFVPTIDEGEGMDEPIIEDI
ncbi:reverse transcriptase domain-containing protein [Tanacetum coccineum]